MPYIAPSTPWESRHTTQLSIVRWSDSRQKFSMHVFMPYTKNEKSGKLCLTQISMRPRFSQVVACKLLFNTKQIGKGSHVVTLNVLTHSSFSLLRMS